MRCGQFHSWKTVEVNHSRLWRVRDGTSGDDQREEGERDEDIESHRGRGALMSSLRAAGCSPRSNVSREVCRATMEVVVVASRTARLPSQRPLGISPHDVVNYLPARNIFPKYLTPDLPTRACGRCPSAAATLSSSPSSPSASSSSSFVLLLVVVCRWVPSLS